MSTPAIHIRRMRTADLPFVSTIQAASPEAAQWPPADYLAHPSLVAVAGRAVVGFAVARPLPPDELEILNIAVDPKLRRHGIGRALLQAMLEVPARTVYLEVRASNLAARNFYTQLGFAEAGQRKNYYGLAASPGVFEDAIVMKMQKW